MTDLALNSTALGSLAERGSKGLRIGLVGPLPPPAGGMATQCQQLYELLRREGLDVALVQTNAPYRPQWIGAFRGVRALFRLVPYLFALRRMCARSDVVHLLAAPAVWVARMRHVPVIINYRGGDAERFLRAAPRWVGATMRAAQACIVPSEFLRRIFAGHAISATIIPNVVDLDLFRPRAGQPSGNGTHIVVTRNLEAIYAIDDALRALALVVERYPEVRLTIAGEGPEREPLEAMAAQLGLGGRVRFAGRLERSAVAQLYREADVMVNPSRIDNMPNSILEAYASGVPVVSTNVGGVPFIAREGETALLVAPRSPHALADGICRLIGDRALAGKLAANGLREVERYRWSEVGGEWIRLYKRLSGTDALIGDPQ
jgi:glycosyltransferase involved in cell wall biosynthesis